MSTQTNQAEELHRANCADNANHLKMGVIAIRRLWEPLSFLIDDNDSGLWTSEVKTLIKLTRDIAGTLEAYADAIYEQHNSDVPF